jgi:bifunctional non-homologous end joining protein LigD
MGVTQSGIDPGAGAMGRGFTFAKLRKMPPLRAAFLRPMLVKAVHRLPEGERWVYEVKLDGYRGVAVVRQKQARLFSRNQKEFGNRFSRIVHALGQLHVKEAVFDGEVVILTADGRPSFQDLQHPSVGSEDRSFYYVFDLLQLNQRDVRSLSLLDRRTLLEQVLEGAPEALRITPRHQGDPNPLLIEVMTQGLEGIVAKDLESKYESGQRTGRWQKYKIYQEAALIVFGYLPQGDRAVGALVLGRIKEHRPIYVACMDLPYPLPESKELRRQLDLLKANSCPFAEIPEKRGNSSWSAGMRAEEKRTTVWLRPIWKAEVAFQEWTRGGFLRHARIKRLIAPDEQVTQYGERER